MLKQLPTCQRIRKVIVILAFLSFPVTMNFLSPYVIIDGAMNGIINGSLVMFGLMFVSSLFLGRAWCEWSRWKTVSVYCAVTAWITAQGVRYVIHSAAHRELDIKV